MSSSAERFEIDLTQRYDNLSTEGSMQYRFYCDECGDPTETTAYAVKDNPQDVVAQCEYEARKWLNLCRYCAKWVCANCWHAFQGMCENCAELPESERKVQVSPDAGATIGPPTKPGDEEDREVTFSSIMGTVCGTCTYPLMPGTEKCPNCGADIDEEVPVVEYDPHYEYEPPKKETPKESD